MEGQTDDQLPVLFTLTHPLDDLRPVTFRRLVSFSKGTQQMMDVHYEWMDFLFILQTLLQVHWAT